MTNQIYKNYNLVSKRINIKFKDCFDNVLYKGFWVPAIVLAEYPKFFIVEILEHINPNENFGFSHPYKLGINKSKLVFGEVLFRPQE